MAQFQNIQVSLISTTVTNAIQVPAGYTLVGVYVPELTSTSFTIAQAFATDGTFNTLKDPTGLYTGSAGSTITFTIGATSIGTHVIPPSIGACLNSWIKLTFSSSESAGITLIFREIT